MPSSSPSSSARRTSFPAMSTSTTREPRRRNIASSGGVLGWGVAAAIGAKIAAPERQVFALVGDGSFQFRVAFGARSATRFRSGSSSSTTGSIRPTLSSFTPTVAPTCSTSRSNASSAAPTPIGTTSSPSPEASRGRVEKKGTGPIFYTHTSSGPYRKLDLSPFTAASLGARLCGGLRRGWLDARSGLGRGRVPRARGRLRRPGSR